MRRRNQGGRLWLRRRKSRGAFGQGRLRTFFVADLGEARRVRSVASEPAIYVLNGIIPGAAAAFPDLRARPGSAAWPNLPSGTPSAPAGLARRRRAACRYRHEPARRFGERRGRARPRIRAENHGITLLMSHLACSELPEHPLNARQISVFREVRVLYRGVPSSLANSSGIFLGASAIATWCARALRSTASIRSRGKAIRCARHRLAGRASRRCAPFRAGNGRL